MIARSRLGLLTLSVHAEPLARHAEIVQADPGLYLMIQLNKGSLSATSSSSSREVLNTLIYVPVLAVPAAAKNRSVQ